MNWSFLAESVIGNMDVEQTHLPVLVRLPSGELRRVIDCYIGLEGYFLVLEESREE